MPHSPPKPSCPTRDIAFNEHETAEAAAFFAPDSLPLPKIRRAWDRKPVAPFGTEKNVKTVWRRYDTRSSLQSLTKNEDGSRSTSPHKQITKKLRLRGVETDEEATLSTTRTKRTYRATKFDRRKSALPRKLCALAL